ncbi:pupal cuticle protein G1A-like [Zerene cesonia]|uniref:pupal cuticle protein G1A-like n=1 Tax=Zerene cesonia TaxID=33412 RepID=UPI0018E4DCFB|nr:pupal cuticle protein G1A-like [Zerene cesonia]
MFSIVRYQFLDRTTQTKMFKLVVFSALFAAAVASPGLIAGVPFAYTSTVISPATTTISRQASSVIHPSPLYSSGYTYSAIPAYAHLIKKRSAPLALSTYIAPSAYVARAPLVSAYAAPIATTYSSYATPLIHTSPIYTAAHLIKKRSAPLAVSSIIAPSTYVARAPFVTTYTAAAPLTTTYAAAPIATSYATPLIHTSPIYASAHLIKKRSVPLAVTSYIAPTTYVARQPFVTTYAAAAPLTTSYAFPTSVVSHAPIATVSHFIKK